MKKTAMFTLAFMAIVSLVSAQRKQNSELSPMDRSKKSTEKMATMLGLDELQKNRIIEAKAYRITQIQMLNEKYQGPARKDHKEDDDVFDKRRIVVRYAGLFGREASGSNCAERMTKCVEPAHACYFEQ